MPGIVVTTSGRQVGDDSAKYLLSKVGDNADILALTFHPGKLCIDRGNAFEDAVKGKSDIHVTYSEITVPGQVQNGNALAQAWLTSHPTGGSGQARHLVVLGRADDGRRGGAAAGGTDRRRHLVGQWKPAGRADGQGWRHDRHHLAAGL